MTTTYKVFRAIDPKGGKGKYQIFICPSAPDRYDDRVPYIDSKNDKKRGFYTTRQAAYRRIAELEGEKPRGKKEDQAVDAVA